MPQAIQVGGAAVDLSPRYFYTEAVTGSPAAATETIIATLAVRGDLAVMEGVRLACYCAFTAGTDGASAVLRIRQTDASGTVIKASGAVNVTAANLYDRCIFGVDEAAALPNQVYVATLTVASASAASTVSAVILDALVI